MCGFIINASRCDYDTYTENKTSTKNVEEKYETLEQELTKPEVLSDIKKTREYSKEMAAIEDIVNCYKKYKRVLEDIENTKEMLKDPDLGEIAKEELKASLNSSILLLVTSSFSPTKKSENSIGKL